ncbi:Tumor necrosis factor receptor superfamily member 19 [Bagarius yarrelli]|uniref:Tumor necrosis factor receptor superfamily member 19 n=1 Tax=Bagarius yarrelli TaxID=175774 RepID=A0A556U7E8_BAGYA|nr:Tumor necrosis factor receptor superfamily member 19 [Bagarius yarrelli]
MTLPLGLVHFRLLKILCLHLLLVAIVAEERRACREQEYKDQFGNCIACRQCDAGQELSKPSLSVSQFAVMPIEEKGLIWDRQAAAAAIVLLTPPPVCFVGTLHAKKAKLGFLDAETEKCLILGVLAWECGFGYGEDAHCVPCKASRFKEDQSSQKCKPCLDCANLNRFQKSNCSSTSNAVCGECLPGFYRKTKLSGFQDMECIPCGDPPPPYEPHCIGRVNLVPIPSTVTSPRDMALAAVICSALATVLLALFILCVIYCKRQLLEKKPALLRSQDGSFIGAELSYLDRREMLDFSQRPCCYCHYIPEQTHGRVHLSTTPCCDDTCIQRLGQDNSSFHSLSSLTERLVQSSAWNSQCNVEQAAELLPVEFCEELSLMEKDVDRTHVRPYPLHSSNASSEENEEETVSEKEQHGSTLVSTKPFSELLPDDNCLAEQHLSTVEGKLSQMHIFQSHGHLVKGTDWKSYEFLLSYKPFD